MPEGDTIHRTARTLSRVLRGEPLEAFVAPRLNPPFPARGTLILDVEARGKHLLLRFEDGLVLHTHLGMPGSWHVYRPGEPWQRRDVRARVAVPDAVAVCFSAPVVELLDDGALERHPVLRRLGPDLCLPAPDLDAALERMATLGPGRTIGEVLLDQHVAAGIGNVYRSETCFLEKIDPRTPLAAVPLDRRRSLLARGGALLRANLTTVRRTTVPGGPPGALFVYGREGRGCRRCGTAIRTDRLGEHARTVFWCPTCQPVLEVGGAPSVPLDP